MPVAVPELQTPRLLLRGHRLEDFDAHAALWADPVVTRFIGGRPFSREEAWVRMLRHAGMWATMGFGFWAVVDRQSGRLVGEAGFHELRRSLQPPIEGTLEAGWGFAPDMYGKGIATESMSAVFGWRARSLPGRRVTCLIDPNNKASVRVAEKLGFREFARAAYHGAPVVLFELTSR